LISFFIAAGPMGLEGEKIRPFVEKYFNWISLFFAASLKGRLPVVKWRNWKTPGGTGG